MRNLLWVRREYAEGDSQTWADLGLIISRFRTLGPGIAKSTAVSKY
jgi:hypothetical protein